MMKEFLVKIHGSLDPSCVEKYIEEEKNPSELSFDKQIYKYFPNFRRAEEILKNIHLLKLTKGTEEDTKNLRTVAHKENEEMLRYIRETKNKMLNKINDTENVI